MINSGNGAQSAFPATDYFDERPIGSSEGLSKRELFAALAMVGLLAADSLIDGDMVRDSIFAADLLLEQLAKTKPAQ